MQDKVLVVAGNYEQYEYWLQQQGLDGRKYRYVAREADLLGFPRDTPVQAWGEYWRSPLWGSPRLRMMIRDRGTG